ncbi:heat shock 70 kDa protein 12A-like [Ruditapes philippinarum]|uniref:heat shock 70 kDa protein 12A-like n=1 Tax=Ruditapes philippinarum TaxID=129788 RepID=UPI00295A7693|nr:heat shock 70 kDa protein 12A-like [Ruditapes philippinarum]
MEDSFRQCMIAVLHIYSRQRGPDDRTDSADVGAKKHKIIVVAIEVGNEWSGYAYSFSNEYLKDPLCIKSANNLNYGLGNLSVKTRSVVLFDENQKFHSFGFGAEEFYSDLTDECKHRKWFFFKYFMMKLSGRHITRNIEIEDNTGRKMKAIEVIGPAIKYLKEHMLSLLENKQTELHNKDIHWVLIVPAIWTDSAKQLMGEAAYKAGIAETQLTIVTKPETAMIYHQTEKQIRKLRTADLCIPGTKCMVIDLGENTCDFTIYECQSDGGHREIKAATGISCGENMVIEGFHELIRNITGDAVFQKWNDEYAYDRLALQRNIEEKLGLIKHNRDGFETFKVPCSINKVFREINHEDIGQATERSRFNGNIKWIDDKLRIDGETVKSLFTPCTDTIVDHAQYLLNEPGVEGTSIFLMVGRLFESAIVEEAIKIAFPTVNIISAAQDMVVLKGAVIHGHQH